MSLSRCIKKRKKSEKRGEKGKKNLSIYLSNFFSVWQHFWPACAYAWACMVRSGLLLLTGSRWNAVRCYGIQLVLANHRRRVAGYLANKLHCLLHSFWFLPTDEARGISGEMSWINHL